MQAPINIVFPKISRPQSAGIDWELFQPSQGMPVDQGIHFSEAKPHIFSGAIEDRPDASFFLEPTLSLESSPHLPLLSRPITGLLTALSPAKVNQDNDMQADTV